METEPHQSTVNMKLVALVAVVLSLLLMAMCYVGFLLIRSIQPVQPIPPQVVQPEIPLPTSVPTVAPVDLYLPVVMNLLAPTGITVPTSTLWRFISIDDNDIGTFENVGDPSQRLVAKCKDLKRPPPDEGELYKLDDSGILKPQSESKKFQRFELMTRN